jgi:phosphoglycolate phosphatase-like HAD superfamily hydrolase
MRHIVWDWNGTLLDDLPLVVTAVNAVMADAGYGPITAADYRDNYVRPVHVFYERLFGRPVPDDEWPHLDDVFHHAYAGALGDARLAADAHDALDAVAGAGVSQSLLSMYRDHELVPLVERFDLTGRFVRVDGLRGAGGGPKAPHLEGHLQRVEADLAAQLARGVAIRDLVVIGDAVDDAVAAAHVGARCELEAAGVPIAGSLLEAVELADG